MNPELQLLLERINQLEIRFNKLDRSDRFELQKNLSFIRGRIKGGIYAGQVSSGGVATDLPTGWTSATSATGVYTVTHNLGDTKYAVVVQAFKSAVNRNVFATVTAQTSTSFSVNTLLSDTPTDSDTAFFFILMRT